MKNKTKILTVATIMGILIGGNANAKTEGHYVGLDLINTQYETTGFTSDTKHEDDKVSLGVNYKYAFNINNFFIAPEIFYDDNNAQVKIHEEDQSNKYMKAEELKYRYGVKLNLGYDINDKFALYGTVGFAENRLEYYDSIISSGKAEYDAASATKESIIYGLGAKYSINDKFSVNVAYETSKLDFEGVAYDSDVNVLRVGASYNF